jgi:4,5-dihydroxyphthalate decarboxylase
MSDGAPKKKTLKTLLGTYPYTTPLKSGVVRSDRIDFDFTEIVPVWDGFKGMIREDKYDLSEMAVVTYLLARTHGKPLALLPATMTGRFQHPYAIYNAEKGALTPRDLNGKRVGIRSFTTTTGAWIRGILAADYGVDLDSIEWITFEEPHVAEYRDTTKRASAGKKIVPMLLDGELDAVLGETSDDPRAKSLFGDPQAEARRWFVKHKLVPINHLVVMRAADVRADPETVREVWRLLQECKRLAPAPAEPDPVPFGIEANRPSLEMIADYVYRQGLIPCRITVDEMFAETKDLVSG